MVSTTLDLGKKNEYKETPLHIRYKHNRRLFDKTKNSIFDTKYNFVKNYLDLSTEENVLEEELVLQKYIKKMTKRKSQLDQHILESTINISTDEEITNLTEEELQKFLIEKTEKHLEFLKEKYGIKIYQYRLHMDEGHYDENNEIKKNIHIHFIHSNITKEGKSFTREIFQESKKGIDLLQDYVSQNFGLKRGKVGSEQKHLNKEDYKQMIIQRKINRKKETEEITKKVNEDKKKLLEDFETKKKEIEKLELEQFLKLKDKKFEEEITKTKIKFQEKEIELQTKYKEKETKLKEDFNKEKTKKIEEFKELTKENWVGIVSNQNEELTKKNRRLEIENDVLKIDNKNLKENNKDLKEKVNYLNFLLRGFFGFFGNLYNEKLNEEKNTKEEIINFIQIKSENFVNLFHKNTKEIEKKKTIIDNLKDKYEYVKNLFEYKDEEDLKVEEKQKYHNDLNKEVNIPQKMEDNKEEDKKVIVEYKGERGYFTEEIETNNFGLPIGTKKKFVKIGK